MHIHIHIHILPHIPTYTYTHTISPTLNFSLSHFSSQLLLWLLLGGRANFHEAAIIPVREHSAQRNRLLWRWKGRLCRCVLVWLCACVWLCRCVAVCCMLLYVSVYVINPTLRYLFYYLLTSLTDPFFVRLCSCSFLWRWTERDWWSYHPSFWRLPHCSQGMVG